MNQLKVLRNWVVWEQSPLYLSGWIPSRWRPLLSLSLSSVRSPKVKGLSLVPCGRCGGLPQVVCEDCTLKDPKGSFSSTLSLSLLGSSKGVGALLGCSCRAEVIAAVSCSEVKNPPSMGWVSMWDGGRVGGQVGTPVHSSNLKSIPGRGWFLSPNSLQASRKHSNLFSWRCTSNHIL